MTGANSGDWFGYSVAGADVDGDGYADIVVGAPRADALDAATQKTLKDAGKVYIYSGATGALIASVAGTAAADNLGMALANAGRVDADANDDIVIGVPKADVLTDQLLKDAGMALVCSGATVAASSQCDNATALFHIDGKDAGAWLGRSVAGAGDVNGDGRADVIVGAPKADADSGKDAGVAVLYDGASGQQWARLAGEQAGSWFGYAVAGAGDLDGDGNADIVVGAYKYDVENGALLKDAGAVYALSCVTQDACQLLFFRYGEAAGDRFGFSVAAGGDIDLDGHADIITATPKADAVDTETLKPIKDSGFVEVMSGRIATQP